MIIIGCDIGLKRIGLAGVINNIILPFEPIIRKNRKQAAKDLSEFLEDKKADILVVGIPSDFEDTQKRIKHFIALLDFKGKIEFVDENNSSLEAFKNILHMKKQSRQKAQKNGKIDSIAACKILERFYKP